MESQDRQIKPFQLTTDKMLRQQLREIMIDAAYGRGICLHPDSVNLVCEDPIESHTIQKSSLRLIANKRNQVYTQHTSLSSSTDIVFIKKLGVNKASTFRGFCSRHDNEIFRPIEDHPLQLTKEQVALHSYRAECRQLYFFFRLRAYYQNHILPHAVNESKLYGKLGLCFHLQTGSHCEVFSNAREASMISAIRSRDYSNMRYVALVFDTVPEIMTCTCIVPSIDVQGNHLQYPYGSAPLHTLCISLLPYNERKGVLLFSWYNKSHINERFMQPLLTLLTLDAAAIPDTVVRFLFHHVKDIYFSPRWWDKLPTNAKDNLSQRFLHNYRGRQACYDDSEDDGYQYVDWNITDFETSFVV